VTLHHLIATYGYAAVFVLVGAESLGVPLPGETTLILAATYAGTTHKLSILLIFAVAGAAAIIGDTTGYWIGDTGGYWLVRRYGHYVGLDEKKLLVARYLFDRRGGLVVFFGRFVSVLRTYAAFLAGVTRMRYREFLLFNASGGILWAAAYSFGAYYASSALKRASRPVEIAGGAIAVLVIVTTVVLIRRKIAVLTVLAEEKYGAGDASESGGRPTGGDGDEPGHPGDAADRDEARSAGGARPAPTQGEPAEGRKRRRPDPGPPVKPEPDPGSKP